MSDQIIPLEEHETVSDWSADTDIEGTLARIDKCSPKRGRCYYFAFKNALEFARQGYVSRVGHGYYQDAKTIGVHAWTEYYDPKRQSWIVYDEASGIKDWKKEECTKNYRADTYQRIKL